MGQVNLEILNQELLEIQKVIPKPLPPARPDLFTISGFPHFETVLSNWFAYFLESDNATGFSEILTESLKVLMVKKIPQRSFDWMDDQLHVFSEVMTNKGNFIDLLLYNTCEENEKIKDSLFQQVIIIEHKVEALLYNDLNDYYASIKINEGGSKTGIVLSARPMEMKTHPSNFINIHYQELLTELFNRLGKAALNADLTQLSYFKDFLNNLDRMSTTKKSEALEFCFQHGQLIQKVTDVKQEAELALTNSLRSSLAETRFNFQRLHKYSIALRSNDNLFSLVIGIGNLFSKRELTVQFWLYKDAVTTWLRVPNHDALIENFGTVFSKISERKPGAKEWHELFRDTFYLEAADSGKVNFEASLNEYLNTKVNPFIDFVLNQMSQYTPQANPIV